MQMSSYGPRKFSKNQDGMGFIEILLIILILIILALLGWYVWNTKKKADQTFEDTKNGSSQSSKPQQKSEEQTATDAKSAEKTTKNIVKFKELGVQITVPDTLKDIVYSVRDGELDGGKTFKMVDVSTSSLVALDSECKPTGSAPPLGGLSKTDGAYPKNADNTNSGGNLIKQFKTYYIAYGSRQAYCSEKKTVQDKAEALREAFEEAIKTVEEIPS